MKKTNLLIFITLLCLIFLFGCKKGKAEEKSVEAEPKETRLTVQDDLGRTVVMPKNPQRILALNSASMEALFSLGITPVGKVENYKIRPEGINLPSVGMPAEINLEACASLMPDLIFAHSRFHSAIINELEQTGATVYCFNPDKINGTLTMYIAKLIGKEDAAKAYDEAYNSLCKKLAESIHAAGDIRTGIIVQAGDTIKAAQSASGYGAVLVNLGIKNIVPAGLPNSSNASFVDFDMETITTENPDIILIVSFGGEGNGNGGQKGQKKTKNEKNKYFSDPAWVSLDAAKNNMLIILPDSVNPNKSTQTDMIQTAADCILEALQKRD